MTKKEIIILITTHLCMLLGGTIIFVSLFHTKLFSYINVFFYRGIALLIFACMFTTVIEIYIKRKNYISDFTYRDIILSVSVLFSFCLVVFTHLPVTADRSVSVFILGYMNTHSDKSFTQNDLTDILTEVYIDENTAIDKRLKEQTISGNVTTDGDRYQISQQGKLIMDFYIKVADLFNVDKKNLSK